MNTKANHHIQKFGGLIELNPANNFRLHIHNLLNYNIKKEPKFQASEGQF